MKALLEKYFLHRYSERSVEEKFQARVLILVHIFLIMLLCLVFFMGYSIYNMKIMIIGIILVSLISIFLIHMGHLTTVTVTSYAFIGLFSTLLVFGRDEYHNYEVYMLGFIHMFIMVVSSLLTYQRRYILFTTGMSILYLLLLLLVRGFPLSTPESPIEIDDYIIAASLITMAGFIIESTVRRRKTLLQEANDGFTQAKEKAIELKQSLDEKELLLNEVHHRVKNNLNVAISLQRLQIRNLNPENEAVEAFQESISRLNSMALVHERLYSSENLKTVEFKPYIHAISNAIVRSFQKPNIWFGVTIDDGFSMDITKAVPCGLILNELITNICKHAYPGDQKGIAGISITQSEAGMITLVVSDEGIGIPGSQWPDSSSLGVHLITLLTEQLGGTIEMKGDSGTTVTVTFPLESTD